jgi:glycerophosphoryl diester phosphodiesterase
MAEITSETKRGNELNHASPVEALSTQREPGQLLRFIAHQGAQGRYPTNSLPALESAFGVADCVEFDVYVASRSDGKEEIVAIHPEGYFLYVNPNPMQNEKPLPMTFEQTREFTVEGQPLIPTIDEIINRYVARCAETGKRSELHIELKGPGTAEVVLPILQRRIAQGDISYQDFALTGLSYPGDRGRLVVAREIDPQVRLVFVARGGDYAVDGFNGLDDALAFANSIGADTFTVARRGLPLEDVAKIREAGFKVGTFHCRTSDEAEAAVSLGAEYVAADLFKGASVLSYPGARVEGCPLYTELDSIGFFHTRDWIWEIGWEAEKSLNAGEKLWAFPYVASEQLMSHGGLYLQSDGETILRWAEKGKVTGDWVDFSSVPVSEKFVRQTSPGEATTTTWQSLLSAQSVSQDAQKVIDALGLGETARTMIGATHKSELDFDTLVAFSERAPQVDNAQEEAVHEVARQVLTRYGRLVGTAAFTALRPRHGQRDEYTVVVEAPHIEGSNWAKQAVEQQVAAQGLRSGKPCSVFFAGREKAE